MSWFKKILGAAAPIVGGMFGGPVGAAIGGAVGGAINGRAANRAAQQQQQRQYEIDSRGAEQNQINDRRYTNMMQGMMPGMQDAYRDRGATVNNGFGTGTVDPATGQASYELNGPYKNMRDQFMGGASDVMGQLRGFNPQAMAADRYGAAQSLIAPQRQLGQQNLMQDLFNKGGFGLTLNQPAAATPQAGQGFGGVGAGTGSVGVNPYIQSFTNANNQQDSQMAYDSLNQGQSYMDNLLRRSQGMLGTGMGIEREGQGSMRDAMNARDSFNTERRRGADMLWDRQGDIYRGERDAGNNYWNRMTGFRGAQNQANGAAQQEGFRQTGNLIGTMPWDKIGGAIGGMFNRSSPNFSLIG